MYDILYASPVRRAICRKYDTCIYDIFSDCSHDCPNCPRTQEEPDPDYMREMERER